MKDKYAKHEYPPEVNSRFLLIQYECTKECYQEASMEVPLPASWDQTITLELEDGSQTPIQYIQEAVDDGIICPHCGKPGIVLNIHFYAQNDNVVIYTRTNENSNKI